MATNFLIKVQGNATGLAAAVGKSFGAADTRLTEIMQIPAGGPAGQGMAAAPQARWFHLEAPGGRGWEGAHALLSQGQALAAGGEIALVEPDHAQQWLQPAPRAEGMAAAAPCSFEAQDHTEGKAVSTLNVPDWAQQEAFSGFLAARGAMGDDAAEKQKKVLVAHLDTGFDPAHITCPAGLERALQRNFVDAEFPDDATDRVPPGASALRNPGHGTATLALLAGNRLDGTSPELGGFTGAIGAAPDVRVMPVRIADWVVRFTTGTMVQGFEHARKSGAHVLSMSMGGLTSAALVDAINLAYDSGMVVVTAAGNNYSRNRLTPRSIVFPARYRRVIAACGVMADGRPYFGLTVGAMQGNHGPSSKMATALGAFTPNVPWAVRGCGKLVDMNGAGTSAATPQIAAAAALWIAEHYDAVMAYPQPWMRVEAVRRALFDSAARQTAQMAPAETFEMIGNGVLKAEEALKIAPKQAGVLSRLPPAEVSFGWIDLLLGGGVSLAAPSPAERMLALELTQMAQRVPEVEAALRDPDLPADQIPAVGLRRYLEAALDLGQPSAPLKARLEAWLQRPGGAGGGSGAGASGTGADTPLPASGATTPPPQRRHPDAAPPPARRLRSYALDPSLGLSMEHVAVNQTTLHVRWEDGLKPGPVGDYLEVVDVDPASNRVYAPVDLNHPHLLAQDGLAPSEGDPQFHQQMVYAVAMTTIDSFEKALGRKALWAPQRLSGPAGPGMKPFQPVRRLRIYPHALRTRNAYYSPDKKALLLGYFPADSSAEDATAPGSMVFSCLSSDIIAHEMSHALLDGLHRRMQEISNHDVPAFHEAFADIVALFQHFAIPELVRFQIARTEANLGAAHLLAGLARQFGEGTGRHGALRDYLSGEPRLMDPAATIEPHARAQILVAAVYDAFLRIVDHRIADLIRIATSGSGVLPPGALHPDLVNRVAGETCKTARHVLTMCIRALDYCPAIDITFGEYLRALITADIDTVAIDAHHYRVAFLESFRKFRILPRDVRTISEETLRWGGFAESRPPWLGDLLKGCDLSWDQDLDRDRIWAVTERNRFRMHQNLTGILAADPSLCAAFGLLPGIPRYDETFQPIPGTPRGVTTFDLFSVRPARRIAPDGTARVEVVATILQRRPLPIDPAQPGAGQFWFRGGATLIIDPRHGHQEIRYAIVKNSSSTSRAERQRQVIHGGAATSLRALYFGQAASEPFALLHSDDGEG